jgi:tRNA threonylcarbamoyladenosine biosynthesis protein TsaB
MSYLLLLETSSKNCSVALADEQTVLSSKSESAEHFIHAEKLHAMMQELFREQSFSPNSLGAIAVSKGPGSYTGLRSGVSAAKGLCFSLNIPLLAIDTTESLARHAAHNHPNATRIIAMIDARRMEVYAAHYDACGNRLTEDEAVVIDANSFQAFKEEHVVLVGDGAEKCRPFLHEHMHIEAVLPSASMMHAQAVQAFRSNSFQDIAYFEPFYLKEYIPGTSRKSVL